MKQRLTLVLTALLGVAVGVALPRLTVPAMAQTPAPSMTASMPMGGMSAKSPADRAYMGAVMQMQSSMAREPMSGNPDRDFLTMMIPHHQSAVRMAQAELQYGKDPKAKALARNIITAQQKEVR